MTELSHEMLESIRKETEERKKEKVFGFIPAPHGWRRISWALCDEQISKRRYIICIHPIIGWTGYIEPQYGYRSYESVFGYDASYCDVIDSFKDDDERLLGFLQPGEEFKEDEWLKLVEDKNNWKRTVI